MSFGVSFKLLQNSKVRHGVTNKSHLFLLEIYLSPFFSCSFPSYFIFFSLFNATILFSPVSEDPWAKAW